MALLPYKIKKIKNIKISFKNISFKTKYMFIIYMALLP